VTGARTRTTTSSKPEDRPIASGIESGITKVRSGRYVIFTDGRESGEERWTLESGPAGLVVTGEQETVAPHPFPSRLAYRVTLTDGWRVTGIELRWVVGDRELVAVHSAEAERWRARLEYGHEARQQEGDYPAVCEIEIPSHLSAMFVLARRDFQLGGEHEFPVLRIGPPVMAVSPERMLIRCVEQGTIMSPHGPVAAKRYIVSLPPAAEAEGYTFWADDDGFVLESYEGSEPERPWMQLVELSDRA
jgi:hypothetical protein